MRLLTTTWARWSNRSVKFSLPKFVEDWIADWRSYLAEFLGTFVFVFVASSAVISDSFYGGLGILGIAFVTGMTYGAMVFVTLHISGGHINPAITLSVWLAQKISGIAAATYVICQMIASFVAAGAILLSFGSSSLDLSLGVPILGIGINQQSAVIFEAVMSAILVFAFFAVMVDRKGETVVSPMILGVIVFVLTAIFWPVTGAVMNPAKVIGPAVVSKSYENLLVWIIGPATGALMGIVYDFVFLRKGKS